MMKTLHTLFACSLLLVLLGGCEKKDSVIIDELSGTTWTAILHVDHETDEQIPFDESGKQYHLIFQTDGSLWLSRLCGHYTGKYRIGRNKAISFSDLGQASEDPICAAISPQDKWIAKCLTQSIDYSISDGMLIIRGAENSIHFQEPQLDE